MKIEVKALIEGVEDRSYVHPFRLESRCVSLSIFKQQSFLHLREEPSLSSCPHSKISPKHIGPSLKSCQHRPNPKVRSVVLPMPAKISFRCSLLISKGCAKNCLYVKCWNCGDFMGEFGCGNERCVRIRYIETLNGSGASYGFDSF